MKNQLKKLIDLKDSDKKIQIIVGIATIVLAPFTFCTSFFLLGITHAFSTIYWMLKKEAPRTNGRKIIEPINLVVMMVFIGGEIAVNYFFQIGDGAAILVIGLLCIGPILGISYFVITVNELKLFRLLSVSHQDLVS